MELFFFHLQVEGGKKEMWLSAKVDTVNVIFNLEPILHLY